jgi:hypothetical protein
MIFALITFALAMFLCGAAIGVLLLVVLGIRSDAKSEHLTDQPATHREAIARRVLGVGIRSAKRDESERG